MKISDFIFRYSTVPTARCDSLCRVRLYATEGTGVCVLLTDLVGTSGGSVLMNSVEFARRALIRQGHIPQTAIMIEHHESSLLHEELYLRVTFDDDRPQWEEISLQETADLFDCTQDSLLIPTLEDVRLASEIERIKNQIDPFMDSPFLESPDVRVRRDEIAQNMMARQTLQSLVNQEATERQLQGLLKKDLTFISEIYAYPPDEYIAFSEFPIGDGAVDFALFSGRSRMDVTLIEIKGADFSLINSDGYRNFSAKFNEAHQQIRRRLGYINKNYLAFREFAHGVREVVESGHRLFNAVVGPVVPLKVDPEKDISFHYVVIAGRTTNDLEESQKRHEVEISFNPAIKIETWDSWINKLRRN